MDTGLIVGGAPRNVQDACTARCSPAHRFSVGQLAGVAVPLMLGAGPTHALAPEVGLRPLLTHLGAVVPTTGLYVLDSEYDDPAAYAEWLAGARPAISALLDHPRGATA